PPGPPAPPRRVPPGVLALLVPLPEREVARVFLELVLLLLFRRVAQRILVLVTTRQPPVVREAGDTEVDVAAGGICESALEEPLDEPDDSRAVGGRPRHLVRHAQPEIARVPEVPAGRLLGERGTRARRGSVDLVVDVRDVVDERHLIAALAQPAAQPHPEHE